MKARIIILLALVSFTCKDALNVAPSLNALSEQFSKSQEFRNTLVQTKVLLRSSTLQMIYARSGKGRQEVLNEKVLLAGKTNLTESEILKFFNYPTLALFQRDANALANSFDKLYSRFPAFIKLSTVDKETVLKGALESFQSNYLSNNNKKDNAGGRIQTCTAGNSACINAATNRYYIYSALCVAAGTGGIIAGIITLNPFIGGGGFALGLGCLEANLANYIKQLSLCYATYATCTSDSSFVIGGGSIRSGAMDSNGLANDGDMSGSYDTSVGIDVSSTSDIIGDGAIIPASYDMNSYYDATYWPEVSAPYDQSQPYTTLGGDVYYYN